MEQPSAVAQSFLDSPSAAAAGIEVVVAEIQSVVAAAGMPAIVVGIQALQGSPWVGIGEMFEAADLETQPAAAPLRHILAGTEEYILFALDTEVESAPIATSCRTVIDTMGDG